MKNDDEFRMGKMILYSAVESTENYKINKKMFFQEVLCRFGKEILYDCIERKMGKLT